MFGRKDLVFSVLLYNPVCGLTVIFKWVNDKKKREKRKSLVTQVNKGLKQHRGKGGRQTAYSLSFSTLSHTGLKKDREVGHGNGMIYLRQVAPPGVNTVPGDTLFSVHSSSPPSHTYCTHRYLHMHFKGKKVIKVHDVTYDDECACCVVSSF